MNTPVTETEWTEYDCHVDEEPYYRRSCGLIALTSDIVIEREVRNALANTDVSVFVSRVEFRSLASSDLLLLGSAIPEAAKLLINQDRMDVIAVGCSAAAMAIGPERLRESIQDARTSVLVTDPVTAALTAFQNMGMRRIGMLTPYPDTVNSNIEDFYRSRGLDIVSKGSFKRSPGDDISRITPSSILEAAVEIGSHPNAEGLLVSCTALRCETILKEAEDKIGKPVFSSNSALALHISQLTVTVK